MNKRETLREKKERGKLKLKGQKMQRGKIKKTGVK
jgi:hypothetical protein